MRNARFAPLALAVALVATLTTGALQAQSTPPSPTDRTDRTAYTAPAAVQTQTTPPASADLPKTSSRLPLVLLVGTLAALVGFGVHLSRERV